MKKRIFLTVGLTVGTCVIFLIMGNAKVMLQEFASKTYYILPIYLLNLLYIIIGATFARAGIAYFRRMHKGQITIDFLAILSFCIFLLVGIIDCKAGTKTLFSTQVFDILLLCSAFCILRRKKN